MTHESGTHAADPASARLVILGNDPAAPAAGWLAGARRCWQGWVDRLGLHAPAPRTRLCIDDLQGRHFYASDDATPPVAMELPVGTYHITIRMGGVERRYTVALDRGAVFRLRLPRVDDAV